MTKERSVFFTVARKLICDLQKIKGIGDLFQVCGQIFESPYRITGMNKGQAAVGPILEAQIHQRKRL